VTRLLGGPQFRGDLFGEGQLGVRSAAVDRTLAGVRLGPAGGCPEKRILLIGSADNSGSVVSGSGNDPCGNRFREMGLAIETVGKRCKCGEELVALLNFDSPTSADVRPTVLRGGMSTIEKGLTVPGDGGGSSCLGPSLARAHRIADQYPDHHVLFVVLSDFELLDGNVAGVLRDFANFPGQPHAVVLRSSPPQELLNDPRVLVSQVTSSDPPGTLAKAIFNSLTATRRIPFRKR
jgi:hypothetical protein